MNVYSRYEWHDMAWDHPSEDGRYLVAVRYDKGIFIGTWFDREWNFDEYPPPCHEVTHWMYLPQHPDA